VLVPLIFTARPYPILRARTWARLPSGPTESTTMPIRPSMLPVHAPSTVTHAPLKLRQRVGYFPRVERYFTRIEHITTPLLRQIAQRERRFHRLRAATALLLERLLHTEGD